MNSVLKVIVLFAVLVGVIFGITLLATNSPTVVENPSTPGKTSAGGPRPKLLVFPTGVLQWNPNDSRDPANRSFPGHFEPGEESTARFWFHNPNPTPVTLQLARVSCTACSEGSVVAIPLAMQQELGQLYALGTLPFGSFPVSALASSLGEASFQSRVNTLPWVRKKFRDDPHATYEIPAAPPGGAQWGLLELRFTARPPTEFRTLEADFMAKGADDPNRLEPYQFKVHFKVVPPFEVTPTTIDAGEFREGSEARKYPLVISSSTRDASRFPPPIVDVRDSSHGRVSETDLVSVSRPEPLTEAEQAQLSRSRGRVLSAYRATVTVVPRGGESLDIGPVDRLVVVTPLDAKEGDDKSINVKATLNGGVRVAGGSGMDLGQFKSRSGITRVFTIHSDFPEMELEPEPEQTVPRELKVSVEKQPGEAGIGIFTVTVSAPKDLFFGAFPKESVIVFKIKGEKARRVRIPITGQATIN